MALVTRSESTYDSLAYRTEFGLPARPNVAAMSIMRAEIAPVPRDYRSCLAP